MSEYTVLVLLGIAGIFLVGYILGKIEKGKASTISKLINIFKFVIQTESYTLPGKANLVGGILVAIVAVILAFPLSFSLIYQLFFGVQLIDLSVINYIIGYILLCSFTITAIEGLIRWKVAGK